MRTMGRMLVAVILACGGLGVAACQSEGPAERAGKEIDRAAEKMGDQVEDAGDKVEDAVD